MGIEIKPSEVRLNPRPSDPYTWQALQGKEEAFAKIFARNLSDHSIGTYRLLCSEVGKTFEVVRSSPPCIVPESTVSVSQVHLLGSEQSPTFLQFPSQALSFTMLIDKLKEENTRLAQELHDLRCTADTESSQRQIIEEENRQFRSRLECLQNQVKDDKDVMIVLGGVSHDTPLGWTRYCPY